MKYSHSRLVLTLVLKLRIYIIESTKKIIIISKFVLTTAQHGVIKSTSPELNKFKLSSYECDRDLMEVATHCNLKQFFLFSSSMRDKVRKKLLLANYTLIY